jgi:hypothetical protein
MEHTTASETDAVGRYLLGEMAPGEREDFEEHYFACAECGEEVRLAAMFRAGARKVLRESPAPAREFRVGRWFRPKWFAWPMLAPAALSAALALALVYQNAVTIPALERELEAGHIIPTVALRSASRGDGSVARVPAGTTWFTLYFDLPPGAVYARYRYSVTDSAGRTIMERTDREAGESAGLLLSRSRLQAGRYRLTVRGLSGAADAGAVLGTYSFVVE